MFRTEPSRLLLTVLATVLVACATTSSTDVLTAVPITDFAMVAGNWEGLVTGLQSRHEDWVELRIMPDGTYDFGSYRTIGALGGRGTLAMLKNGTLESRSERGTATYTLYQSGAARVLQVRGALADGRPLSAKLTRGERP